MSDDGERVQIDDMEPELPPQLEALIRDIDKDRKSLLRTAAYNKPEQLRQYIAQFVLPRIAQLIEIFGTALYDTYQLSASNARQIRKVHRWTTTHLRSLGAEVNDNDVIQDVASDSIEQFSEAFYALGTKLQEKLPEDKEMQEAYNRCATAFDTLLAELMGEQDFPEDGDGDEDGEPSATTEAVEAGEGDSVEGEQPSEE